MPRPMLEVPDRQRVPSKGRVVGVDRANRVLRGFVVAQLGPFKSEGRGEFDQASLDQIIRAWPSNGLRSRFAHPNESDDGLGKFLGRAHRPYLSTVVVDGKSVPAVRADLHLNPTAFEKNPNGNLGDYVLDLAESDPGALSSSLVLKKKEEWRLDDQGMPKLGADGVELPPLWRIDRLFATDVVDEGDAVDGILAPAARGTKLKFTADYVRLAEAHLDKLFKGVPRHVAEARLRAYLERYLSSRFGSAASGAPAKPKRSAGPAPGVLRRKLELKAKARGKAPVKSVALLKKRLSGKAYGK